MATTTNPRSTAINRRGFLGVLAAGLALDPERALWVPGQKRIFIPRFRDYDYGSGLHGTFRLDGFSERYGHYTRLSDGAVRSFFRGRWPLNAGDLVDIHALIPCYEQAHKRRARAVEYKLSRPPLGVDL